MNLAAAFHDFGKMDNQIAKLHKRPKFEGHTTYVNHEKSSETMAEAIMKSIGVPRDKRNLVNTVIKTHMFPHDAPGWKEKNKGPGRFIEKLKIKGKGGVDDLWKYVFMHARADSMASKEHNEEDFNRGEEWFEEYHGRPSTQYTKNQGTLIDGNVVENLIQEVEQAKQVSIKRNIIRDVLFFLQQQQYTGKIDMSFASLPEGQERAMSIQRAIDDATKRAKSWILSVYNKYIDPPKGGQVMGSNWFKKVKVSQVAPLMGDVSDDDPEVKKGPGKAIPKYYRGMKVKDRRRSVSQPQGYGKVQQIDGDKMKIVWNPGDKENRKEEIFDMVQDTAILSMIVAEV
jgi:hypothetical protein